METINWYKIFYYIAMADGIKQFFDRFSSIFTASTVVLAISCVVAYFIVNNEDYANDEKKLVNKKRILNPLLYMFYSSLLLCLITWFGYVACPSKKDSMVIIAGGAVGTFITSDSSAKQLPSEALLLLRTKIKSEIEDLNRVPVVDSLTTKSKEELINMIKNK